VNEFYSSVAFVGKVLLLKSGWHS